MRNEQQREKCKQIVQRVIKRELKTFDGTEFVLITDNDANAIYVSEGFYNLLGYTPDEIENTSMWDYVHPEDVQSTKVLYSKMTETNDKTCSSLRLRHKDGTWVKITSDRMPIVHDEEINGRVVVCTQRTCVRAQILLRLIGEGFVAKMYPAQKTPISQ